MDSRALTHDEGRWTTRGMTEVEKKLKRVFGVVCPWAQMITEFVDGDCWDERCGPERLER